MILKEIKKKNEKLSVFEKEFEINFEETISIRDTDRDRARWFKAEMVKHNDKLTKSEGALKIMEKKREISDKLMKTLQIENSSLKEKLKDNTDTSNDIEKLLQEINLIQKINQEKETFLADIQNEKDKLEGKF